MRDMLGLSRRQLTYAVVAAAFALTAGGVVGVTATASTGPSVAWAFSRDHITAGTKPSLTYTARHIPRGDAVYLQRQTSKGWVSLARLRPTTRTLRRWTGAATGRGRFAYRIVVLTPRGHVAKGVKHLLYAYGTIPMSAVFGQPVKSASVASSNFNYVWAAGGWNRHRLLFLPRTSCRSVTITTAYSADSSMAGSATIATVVVLQQSASKSVNVSSGTVQSVTSPLSGGAVELVLENAPGQAYGNGTASCWSANGRA